MATLHCRGTHPARLAQTSWSQVRKRPMSRPERTYHGAMSNSRPSDASARYRALCSRDARFDGSFFVGVTSTGIYCRPVCRVRTPRLENCRFFEHPAQAERDGFRPCLRCRPELAPRQRPWSSADAGEILADQACSLLDDPQRWVEAENAGTIVARAADRLGVSDRHLRRIFETHLGVSPLQYLQTCRLLVAKQLLTDTAMPVADVAMASGFGSQRRFNAAFVARYRMNPMLMRRQMLEGVQAANGSVTVRLSWRPPLDVDWLMQFMAQRQIAPMEKFSAGPEPRFFRTLRICSGADTQHTGWISGAWDLDRHQLVLQIGDGLVKVLPSVIRRVREWMDLDADPAVVHLVLQRDFPAGEGLRVPGCLDGFELAVRAILGQQITVAAARTLCARLVARLGDPVQTPQGCPTQLFPSPATIAAVEDDVLGALGITVRRQRSIKALARMLLEKQIDLNTRSDTEKTIERLQEIPGVGPWTSNYIAMRALRDPDAWPPGDVALHSRLGLPAPRSAAAQRAAEQASQAWRPWRSYAVVRAWARLHANLPPNFDPRSKASQ